jgi:glycosyltransferase involved in cell wall biosynthesis
MFHGHRVAAVLPCHNEAELVGHAITSLPPFVDHVVVVDDASTDGTADAARGTGDARVTVLTPPQNLGVGGAMVLGYRWALEHDADLVLGTNGDAQMSGHDAAELLLPLVEHRADLVKGNRMLCPGSRGNIPMARALGIHVFAAMTRVATGVPNLGDAQSGYHAVTRAALQRLPLEALWPRFGFPNDLLMRAAEAGLRIQQRPVRAIYGREVSALKVRHAFHPVGWLLLRGMARKALR